MATKRELNGFVEWVVERIEEEIETERPSGPVRSLLDAIVEDGRKLLKPPGARRA